jgi:hypothetical protein
LVGVEWSSSCEFASVLNDENLEDASEYKDARADEIRGEAIEDVKAVIKETAIEFVEDLAEHEGVEDNSTMKSRVFFNTKDLISRIENGEVDCQLVDQEESVSMVN